jgi:hypothetical protein
MAPSAPAPDSLQGPGFWGGIGNFLTGKPTEQRGRPVQIDGQWRVPKYDANSQFTGYGTLDPSLDARWGPGQLMERQERARQQKKEGELKGLFERDREDRLGRENRILRNSETQSSNAMTLGLAGINQAIEADRNRTDLLQAQITQQGRQAQNTHELATEQLRLSNINQNRTLDLKGIEMQANIALQQGDLALRKEQLADLRGGRKLAFIGQAVASLLA